jgi:hypothetical protein
MRKLSIISAFMLCCSITLFSVQSFAAPGKDDIDVENIKAPPRDVKDILQILSQTRQDQALIDKAKKTLAKSPPSTNDTSALNHYYYQRAVAENALENSKEALENFKKAAMKECSMPSKSKKGVT